MKIWIKLFAGSAIGVLLGVFLAPEASTTELFAFLSELVINIGRYAIFPLILFSLAIGTFELKNNKKVMRVYGRTIMYLVITSALLAIVGAVSVLLMAPERIPIVIEEEIAFSTPSVKDILLMVFPRNLFQVFNDSGQFLLPLYFFSFFLGLNFSFDRLETRPAVQFFDSMSRIFYHINTFVLEIIGLGMIALAGFLVMQTIATPEIELYYQLLLVLGIDTAVILLGIYPGLLYLLAGRRNPYRWLYAVLGPALAGVVSGDSYFSLGFQIRNGKENLGIPREIGSASFPLFALFGRAGTAMVSAVSFIVILKSYSSLGVTPMDLVWVVGFSFLASFTLSSVPGLGTFVALSSLCALYGRGYEEGYLILKPIASILVSFSVLLDVVTASFASMLVAHHEGMQADVDIKEFV
jgi:aerobic C4-dicarboxylate transport protein